ncbi:MAG TPA: amidohydrolase family protein [Chroococcales cyanobacterium]
MKGISFRLTILLAPIFGALCVASHSCAGQATAPEAAVTSGPFTAAELKQFTALDPIDTHVHIYHPSSLFHAMLNRLNLHVIDILVVDNHHGKMSASLAMQRDAAMRVIAQDPDRVKLCTTFDPYAFMQPDFADHADHEMNSDFAKGAVAVKIWKNVGMQIKDKDGHYVLPDNPVFEPLYKDIADHDKTLIAHLADPDTLWAPPNPDADDYSYYMEEEPWWYMYHKAGAPTKQEILRARDHVLEMNPTLRVVGAHLGSLEADMDSLGEHFERYPNFAVDTAGRIPYFEMMNRDAAITFITKYQDRLIYGTDNDFEFYPQGKAKQAEQLWEEAYANQWRYLATDEWVVYHGKKVQGLALPLPILRKLYHDNAVKWFPGVYPAAK